MEGLLYQWRLAYFCLIRKSKGTTSKFLKVATHARFKMAPLLTFSCKNYGDILIFIFIDIFTIVTCGPKQQKIEKNDKINSLFLKYSMDYGLTVPLSIKHLTHETWKIIMLGHPVSLRLCLLLFCWLIMINTMCPKKNNILKTIKSDIKYAVIV